MNILHHKTWNVYNRDNIEKVKKDEKEAAEKEKRDQERHKKAEKERKLAKLREKAKQRYGHAEHNKDQAHEHDDDDNSNAAIEEKDSDKLEPATIGTILPAEKKAKYGQQGLNTQREEAKKKEIELLERKHTIWHLDNVVQDKPWFVSKQNENTKSDKLYKDDPLIAIQRFNRQEEDFKDTKSSTNIPGLSKIEILRQQRLKRETEERKRRRDM